MEGANVSSPAKNMVNIQLLYDIRLFLWHAEMGTKADQQSVIRSGGSNLVDPQTQPFLEFGNDIDPPNQLVIDVFESSVTVSTARGQKMEAPVEEAYLYNHFDIWTEGGGIALDVEEIEGKYNQGDVSLNTLPGITHNDLFFPNKIDII